MSRRLAVAVAATVGVVVVAGAGFAVGSYLSGGGTQPEDVLPDTVIAYVDVDLDPAAEQKVNLARLLGQFPDVEGRYGHEPDLRELAVGTLVDGTELEDAQLDQWVGDRAGVGLAWDEQTKALTPVAAIQTTDADEARADLGRVLDDDQIAVSDGYVVLTGDLLSGVRPASLAALSDPAPTSPSSTSAADLVAAAQQSPLAEAAGFRDVFDHLDDGVLTMYVDGPALSGAATTLASDLGATDLFDLGLADAGRTDSGLTGAGLTGAGLTGAVLRAEPQALELVAWTSAHPYDSTTPVALSEGLPASTLLAFEITDGDAIVAQRWQALLDAGDDHGRSRELQRRLAEIEAQYGLILPDDLQTLLGTDAVVAVDGDGLLTGIPGVALRSLTDPQQAADLAQRLQQALDPLTGGFGVTARALDDGMVVATTSDLADEVASAGGSLGDDPTFGEALPDTGSATALLWLDLSQISSVAAMAAPDAAPVLDPLAALGASATPDDGGTRLRLRLVFEGDGSS